MAEKCKAIEDGEAYRVHMLPDPRLPIFYTTKEGIIVCEKGVCPHNKQGASINYGEDRIVHFCETYESIFGDSL